MSQFLHHLSQAISHVADAVRKAELDDVIDAESMIKTIDKASAELLSARVIAAQKLAELMEKDAREERAAFLRITGAEG